ncbi:MAG: glucose 1-dehydrogenase [Dehalococcoidales bacterium]|nr:MAG: glucose 1-dehydrogenase [Dehalococcoidales bacterium]
MDLELEGKVAIVTGTGSQVGMGKAISLKLANEGCDIVSCDIDLEGATKTADEVKASGRKALAFKTDVSNKTEVGEMVKAALKEFGKIDILVNTAGLASGGGPFHEQGEEYWEKDINVNLYGTMHCIKAVLPGMMEHKSGKIINFSSISGRMGVPVSYAAAKGAVLNITRGLAMQYGPYGINVNGIAPAMVSTQFHGGGKGPSPEMIQMAADRVPLKRIQTVEDIANAVAFLASDVSKNITGQTLQVDGGWLMP